MQTRFILLCLFVVYNLTGQSKEIPEWFMNDLKANVGVWKADNSKYISDGEPFSHYIMEWSWGIGKTSIIGKLYGLKDGVHTDSFWQFRQYWDNENQKAVLLQFGFNGMTGAGTISPYAEYTMESIQTFSLPDGRTWEERHLSTIGADFLQTTSFDKNEQGDWQEKRTYTWKKKLEQK